MQLLGELDAVWQAMTEEEQSTVDNHKGGVLGKEAGPIP